MEMAEIQINPFAIFKASLSYFIQMFTELHVTKNRDETCKSHICLSTRVTYFQFILLLWHINFNLPILATSKYSIGQFWKIPFPFTKQNLIAQAGF
jgi:hypothetical protein